VVVYSKLEGEEEKNYMRFQYVHPRIWL